MDEPIRSDLVFEVKPFLPAPIKDCRITKADAEERLRRQPIRQMDSQSTVGWLSLGLGKRRKNGRRGGHND